VAWQGDRSIAQAAKSFGVLAAVHEAGISPLDRDFLERTSPLRSWRDSPLVTVWQALFVDEDDWPWDV
jgi:hypothetical protein